MEKDEAGVGTVEATPALLASMAPQGPLGAWAKALHTNDYLG